MTKTQEALVRVARALGGFSSEASWNAAEYHQQKFFMEQALFAIDEYHTFLREQTHHEDVLEAVAYCDNQNREWIKENKSEEDIDISLGYAYRQLNAGLDTMTGMTWDWNE